MCFRKNGKNIGPQGSIQTSCQGLDDSHDDVTTGRSLTLHLQRYDQLDVFVEEVIPDGAGLTHTSFCVTLIPRNYNKKKILKYVLILMNRVPIYSPVWTGPGSC